MAISKEQRAQVRKAILKCREILTNEFDQLLTYYGILPNNIISVPADRQEVQKRLKEAISREATDFREARERYLKHAAFTSLNRLLALRVAEANGLIVESVATRPEYGHRSRRERDLSDKRPDLATQPENLAKEALKLAFKEIRNKMNEHLLFSEDSPYVILEPRSSAFRQIREVFMGLPEDIWHEFELLGWAYQFFNSEEREQIRRRLRRNPMPDDIPPLNQFYTVGWIVKALVQNTLGRLWLESHPNSPIREKLDYLVPIQSRLRPPPDSLSVQQIKVLDPACGSGHFLLGAFDLLFEMWREERPDLPKWQIPTLILEHNLFGIDIDLRACQIAAIALMLKACTTFERFKGNDPNATFEPKRINIVCADIRFVDDKIKAQFLKEFACDQNLQNVVKQILQACEDAFEIGSLLRIRKPFEQLMRCSSKNSGPYYPGYEEYLSKREDDFISDIVSRIKEFVRKASEAQDMGSLLFGLDAENALHFVDVLTDHYDIVLMNPPYGAMPPRCRQYAREHYPRTHKDYYAAFIEQAISLCKDGGYIGALTGRTFLFLKSFQKLREEILRSEALPEIVWDLGFNVLDEATARYAAFTLRKRHQKDGVNWKEHPVIFFRLTDWDWDEKRIKFEETLSNMR